MHRGGRLSCPAWQQVRLAGEWRGGGGGIVLDDGVSAPEQRGAGRLARPAVHLLRPKQLRHQVRLAVVLRLNPLLAAGRPVAKRPSATALAAPERRLVVVGVVAAVVVEEALLAGALRRAAPL